MRIALIVSYFQRPDLLDLCLHSISLQTRKPDQLIVIDDGSFWICFHPATDIYIRQEHTDFGKFRLLNKAILETNCDYLVLLDQDCVVPPDFIETHERIAKRDQYVCAMFTGLTPEATSLVTKESIGDGSIWKLIASSYRSRPHIFCGAGSAVWKADALQINGFDTRFQWCGTDTNFGLRLQQVVPNWDHFCNYGRYFHLWHERPYAKVGEEKAKALENARKWAAQSPITPQGIAELDFDAFEVIRNEKALRDERAGL